MSELTTVARPYAKAAFDFAVEQGDIANWQQMLAFASEVTNNETMKDILTSAMSPEYLADLFNKVCADQLNTHGQNFISVLAENSRLAVIPHISILFDELKSDYDKEVNVDVTSATSLSEDQKVAMSAALEKRLARKVKLICSVDPTLVAGVIIKAGDTVIDGSVNSKLNRLSDALQA
ncbi:F0F1 ATP synthase subunit delta [Glaciecola sp. MH2013]|uniref:F0F1 ATP synthase subunit delta n=1 Tax=Glaciecola sp. MH2013 TaxID=2785524 RepID=UPI0018A107DB|nr:F0F1 ATP synthase subunit delta [Glaciecola sp. MH2013]MBF7074638.1 F0F1 ATP synthase subunit delta [Glaciecola sp. MH2013]